MHNGTVKILYVNDPWSRPLTLTQTDPVPVRKETENDLETPLNLCVNPSLVTTSGTEEKR